MIGNIKNKEISIGNVRNNEPVFASIDQLNQLFGIYLPYIYQQPRGCSNFNPIEFPVTYYYDNDGYIFYDAEGTNPINEGSIQVTQCSAVDIYFGQININNVPIQIPIEIKNL